MFNLTKHLIINALAKQKLSFQELGHFCEGIFPSELANVIDDLVKSGDIVETADKTYKLKKPFTSVSLRLKYDYPSITLPHPHPLDYDWRFTKDSATNICKILLAKCNLHSHLLLLGSPSIWLSFQQFKHIPNTTLVDWNDSIIWALKQAYSSLDFIAITHNLLEDELCDITKIADVVFCDPPWYTEYYRAFLWQAAMCSSVGAYIFLSLFPLNTRPTASQDRWELLEFSRDIGFEIVGLEQAEICYETPLFEVSSLSLNKKISVAKDWRRADMLVLRKIEDVAISNKPIMNIQVSQNQDGEQWAEVVIGRGTIKIKGPFDDTETYPKLESIEDNNILPSVSRRYLGRANVDLWLWDNRVFRVHGHAAFRAALYFRAGKGFRSDLSDTNSEFIDIAQGLLNKVLGPMSVLLAIKQLLDHISRQNETNNLDILERVCDEYDVTGHLAILTPSYLDKIISGQKTLESRFSLNRIAPYQRIKKGDIIFLKLSSGPIIAIVQVQDARFIGPMKSNEAKALISKYINQLCVDGTFTNKKKDSRYATLIEFGDVLLVNPFSLNKSDRRSWVILNDRTQASLF